MEPLRENIDDHEAFEKTFPSTEVSSPVVQNESSSPSSISGSSKKRRMDDEKFFFKLFKFPKVEEQYLLELHDELKKSVIDRYRVFVGEEKGRCKVQVHDLEPGDHIVLPMLHDPTIPIFNKNSEIPLKDRLIGWTWVKRSRTNGKKDKFYYYYEKKFRSFLEVVTFVIYSCKVNELIKVNNTNTPPQEVTELESAEVMVKISSLNITKNVEGLVF